jgi:hypothetical protein
VKRWPDEEINIASPGSTSLTTSNPNAVISTD